MTDNERIMRDQVKSLLIVLEDLAVAIDWTRLPKDYRETTDLAIEEAKESIGETADCAAGACRL